MESKFFPLQDKNLYNKLRASNRRWIQRQKELKAIYFDITSVSTYAKLLDIAEWGYNRDKEKLRQVLRIGIPKPGRQGLLINMGIVYGDSNQLPLYYQIYSGSITDVTTLRNIKKYNAEYGLKDVIYVLDRGFYSKSNIEELGDERVIIPLSFSTRLALKVLRDNDSQLNNSKNMFICKNSIYTVIKGEIKINKCEASCKDKIFYAYVFRNKQVYDEKETLIYKILIEIEGKINGRIYTNEEMLKEEIEEIAEGYEKYFRIVRDKDKYIIERNEIIIEEQVRKFGTFILITNDPNQSGVTILELYRRRENIEKVFDCMKNDIDRDRLRVHTT